MNRYWIFKYFAPLFIAYLFPISATSQITVPVHYVGDQNVEGIAFSPDGKRVAVQYAATPGNYSTNDRFVILNAKTGQIQKTIPLEDLYVNWFDWSFDNGLLLNARSYVADGDKRFSFRKLGMVRPKYELARDTLFRLNLETESLTTLLTGPKIEYLEDSEYFQLITINEDRSKAALLNYKFTAESKEIIQQRRKAKIKRLRNVTHEDDYDDDVPPEYDTIKDLLLIDLHTGDILKKFAGRQSTITWKMGADFEPIIRIDEGEYDFVRDFYYPDNNGDWIKTGTRSFIDDEIEFIGNTASKEGLLVVMRPHGELRKGLYHFNPVTGETSSTLYRHPQYDLTGAYSSWKTEKIWFATWWDDTLKRHWIDDNARQAANGLDSKLHDQNWHIIHINDDETIWKIASRSALQRTIIHSWDTTTKTLTPVVKPFPEPSPEKVSKRRRIDYTASDGLALRGYLTAPDTDIKALIVMPHGGPVSRDNLDYDGWAQFLASSGYAVFQPNFRGGDGRGLRFEEKGHKQWGRAMQTDIEDGVNALVSSGRITSDTPRYIIGASYGGYAALTAAFQYPDRYSCAASINGVSDLPAFLEKFDKTDPLDKYLYDIWVKRMGDPQTRMNDLISISPRQNVDKIKASLFVLHGKDDDIVPYQQSETFVEAARKAGKDVKYIALSDLDHNQWSEKQSLQVLSALELFILRCDTDVRRKKTQQ